jgi:phosphatidylinositol 4-kinase
MAPAMVGIGAVLAGIASPILYKTSKNMVISQGRREFGSQSSLDSSPLLTPQDSVVITGGGSFTAEPEVDLASPSTGLLSPRSQIEDMVSPALSQKSVGAVSLNDLSLSRFSRDTSGLRSSEISPRASISHLPMKLPTSGPSIEDLSRGQAFNQTRNKSRLGISIPGSSENLLTTPISGPIPPSPQLSDYFHTELQFVMALCGISDRLRSVPKESRQSSLIAELTLLNHNLPAQVCVPLWCPASGMGNKRDAKGRAHHAVVRVSPTDAVTLNSADRVGIFVCYITLFTLLITFYLGFQVPYLILVEVVDHFHLSQLAGAHSHDELVNTFDETSSSSSSSASTHSSLSTPESKTPVNDPIMALSPMSLKSSSSSSSSELPMSPKSISHQRIASSPRPSSSRPMTPTQSTTPNRTLGPTSSVADEYTQKMRTAAIMLAQLHHQQQRELIVVSSAHGSQLLHSSSHPLLPSGLPSSNISAAMAAASVVSGAGGTGGNVTPQSIGGGNAMGPYAASAPTSAPGSPMLRQKSKTDFEAIRQRLVKEMAALEEKRMQSLQEERAARKAQGLKGDGGGEVGIEGAVSVEELERGLLEAEEIQKDKEDPSGMVFRSVFGEFIKPFC